MALSDIKSLSVAVAGSFLLFLNACGGADNSSETASAENSDNNDYAASSGVEVEEKMAGATADAADDSGAAVDDVSTDVTGVVGAVVAAGDGDATKGRRVFAKCMACHTVQDGQNRVGPSLYGIIGAPAGSKDGFNYTDAIANSGIIWTEDVMFAYLENPMEYLPGTRMIFPGLPAAQDRADVIAYLKSAAD